MQKFTDASGYVWQINITTRDIMRVRQETGFNLVDLFDKELKSLASLYDDPVRLVDIIWSSIGSTVPSDRVRFDNALTGDAIEDGTNALIQAVIDFFPNPNRREACRAMIRKLQEMQEQGISKAMTAINQLDMESLKPAIDSAASSASTQQD